MQNYESESEEESVTEKIRRKNNFKVVKEFLELSQAVQELQSRGFAYDYRIKADPKNSRKVNYLNTWKCSCIFLLRLISDPIIFV